MTYNEFEEKIKELVETDTNDNTAVRSRWYKAPGTKDPLPLPTYIFVKYSTGGVSGGSCWDSSDPQPYYEKHVDDEFKDFYKVLEEFAPNMTYIEVKRLESRIKIDDWTETEYYGNSTDYTVKRIGVKEIYDYLIDKGYLK